MGIIIILINIEWLITVHLCLVYLPTIYHLQPFNHSISFHKGVEIAFTKLWNQPILCFHSALLWSRLLYLILIIVPWREYPVSLYWWTTWVPDTYMWWSQDGNHIFWLKPMFFYQYHVIQSAWNYDKIQCDRIIFYSLYCISEIETVLQ